MDFRKLSKKEELAFRQWARENWKPGDDISPLWHPVVRDEIDNMEFHRRLVELHKEGAIR